MVDTDNWLTRTFERVQIYKSALSKLHVAWRDAISYDSVTVTFTRDEIRELLVTIPTRDNLPPELRLGRE